MSSQDCIALGGNLGGEAAGLVAMSAFLEGWDLHKQRQDCTRLPWEILSDSIYGANEEEAWFNAFMLLGDQKL